MQSQATPEEQTQARLFHELCQLLERGGHPGYSVMYICGRGGGRSRGGCATGVTPGWTLRDTTLRGAPAWYLWWIGAEAERPARLTAYAATLASAGWQIVSVAFWSTGARVRSQLTWAPPASDATVGLLVAPPAAARTSEEGGGNPTP